MRGLDDLHVFEHLAQLLLLFRIHRGRGDEAHPVLKDLAVVLLAEKLVKIDHRPGLDVRLGEDHFGDLGQRGIAGPDFGCGLQLGFEGFLVAAYRGIARLGDVHRGDLLGGLDGSHRLGGIEIFRGFPQLGDQLFGEGIVLDLDRADELIRLLDEGQGLRLSSRSRVRTSGSIRRA